MALLEEDITQLLALKTETKNLDYKESLNWQRCSRDQKLEIVRDILGMANTQDGGRIVFGVRDSDFESVGMPEDDFGSFDQTKVNDLVHKYTNPKHSCQVYKHVIKENRVVTIDTPEFQELPIICRADAHSSDDPSKQILKKGQMYIRTDKATTEAISSPEEMRELLGRALAKKGDELLATIERLIKGKPLSTSDDSKEKYAEELREAEGFLSKNIGEELKNLGQWTISTYPVQYDPKRIPDQKAIRELIQRAEVSLRGWPFPFTDPKHVTNFAKGTQSHTIWDRFVEGYRAYKSGLFICKKAFWEDVQGYKSEDLKPVLSFEYSIWLVTEIFLFVKRYYEEAAPQGDVSVKIVLNGTKNRRLTSFSRSFIPRGDYVAVDDTIPIIEENIKVVDLRASYKDIAYRVIKEAFLAFNWDISPASIRDRQTDLLEGKT